MSSPREACPITTGFSVINIQVYTQFFTPHVKSYISLSLQMSSLFLSRVIPTQTEKKTAVAASRSGCFANCVLQKSASFVRNSQHISRFHYEHEGKIHVHIKLINPTTISTAKQATELILMSVCPECIRREKKACSPTRIHSRTRLYSQTQTHSQTHRNIPIHKQDHISISFMRQAKKNKGLFSRKTIALSHAVCDTRN